MRRIIRAWNKASLIKRILIECFLELYLEYFPLSFQGLDS